MSFEFSRRAFFEASSSLTLASIFLRAARPSYPASPPVVSGTTQVALAPAPAPVAVTPSLIAAAKKEGQVVWYTSIDIPVAERLARFFQEKYSPISVRVEKTGSEILFTRIEQEVAAGIHAADVVNTSDGAHFLAWKRAGLLEQYVPIEVAEYLADQLDVDGAFAVWRVGLCVIAYNTNLVKADEAPTSYADLLDPKWRGKIVKAHPGYSGTIMTATYQMIRDLGWDYLEGLAKQNVLNVRSASDPPKKLQMGERAIMADGHEYNVFQMKESGAPLEVVYAREGTPLITGPSAIFKAAPHPNAARLFQHYLFFPETQQAVCDFGGFRSFHPAVREKSGRRPLREIALLKDDPAAVEAQSEDIKKQYARLFGI